MRPGLFWKVTQHDWQEAAEVSGQPNISALQLPFRVTEPDNHGIGPALTVVALYNMRP